MATLVSSWSKNVESMPAGYVMPPEERPGDFVTIGKDIPVIDLSQLSSSAGLASRADIARQIVNACAEFGFFQVINHGVSEDVMQETMKLYNEFFDMSVEDKESAGSAENNNGFRLFTSGRNYTNEEAHYWKDSLTHPCHPLEQHMPSWPEKPTRYGEVVSTYSLEVRKLTLTLLDLICEGLGLKEGYLGEDLRKDQTLLINHYPPCPDPSLAMGTAGHYDPNLITLLQQEVYGLQIFKDGQWLGVEPLANAFVVNMGHQMQVISNGKLESANHRVVTNTSAARTSICTFISPDFSAVIEPAKELIASGSPSFKPFKYSDFLQSYLAYLGQKVPRVGTALDPFVISA